ncbi:DUF421 domain-containing protein [Acinetobacter haemolyticus]|uniref:DUF421 domain-containing protein n=1 Tax=Acinetobacter haemolyticus TaxID=29430 RepID=UPI000D698E4A|nr:YetF domain-containing protein [Acinetobacter haemolyticus]NCU22237.1 DUF421 domain-containing protein [Acinetobacter haemolyticus]
MEIINIIFHQTTWEFVFEIIFRCFVMFFLILFFLKLSGKRGIRQLSIFEVAIILSLGTAAGDPMLIKEIPLIQAFVVMSTIIILYRITTWSMMKYKKVELFLEGHPICIVKNGLLVIEAMKNEKFSHDEFFAEMRQQSVEHLGQIRVALLETDGCLSILFYKDLETKWGLPIFPTDYKKANILNTDAFYSCMYCGHTQKILHLAYQCSRCQKKDWAKALNLPHIQ